jgi:hypothetical protein
VSSLFIIIFVWSRGAAKASTFAIGGLSLTTLFSRHRIQIPACVPLSRQRQSSELQACTSNSCTTLHRPSNTEHAYSSTMTYPRSRTRVSSDVPRLQRCLHLDRLSRLELVLVPFAELSLFVESQSSLIRTCPEFPGSFRNLVLGAVAYIACWILGN